MKKDPSRKDPAHTQKLRLERLRESKRQKRHVTKIVSDDTPDTRSREERITEGRALLTKEMEADIVHCRQRITDYVAGIERGQHDHLDMFGDIYLFEAAARIRVMTSALHMLSAMESIDDVRSLVTREVTHGTLHPNVATPTKHMSHTLQLASWAHVADRIKWVVYGGSLTNTLPGDDA